MQLTKHASLGIDPGFETQANVTRSLKQMYQVFSFSFFHNDYTKEPTVSGKHRQVFSNFQSCLTDSS